MAEAAAAAFSWVVQQGTKALMAVGFSKGTATAIASFATKAAVTTALSVAATAILAPRVGAEGGALALNDNLDAGIPYVAGRRAVAGVLQHADEFGADERYMGFINVKSGAGPVDAIESNRADSVAVTTDANGMVTSPEVFAGKMWLRNQLGQQPEIAHLTQPGLYQGAMMAGWSSTEKLSGKAAHILTLQQDSKFKSYPAGVPVFESTVRGIKWYDPRLDSTYPGGSGSCRFDDQATWVYSTNGAIHALGYALGLRENGQVVEGFGCPITDIVLEDYVEAANVADMNGWHCNAYWTSKDRPWQVYTAFLQAAGAVHVTKWGKLGCMPRGAARVSLTTISAADTAAAVSIQPLASRRDRINTITPKCPLESHQWAEPDLTPVKIQHYIDNEDGGEVRDRGVHYPFVTNEGNSQQAAQLAAYDILDSREGMTGVIPVRPYLMDLDPGDCFTVTEPGFNLAAQKFLVQKRSFDFETGVSILHLISETDGKHALALGQSSDAPDAPSLVAPDLTSVPAPGVSVWSAVAGTGDQPNLVVTGATDNVTATHVRLEYRLTTPSGGGSWPDDDTGWVIYDDFPIETENIMVTGLEPNTSYQVAVSYISAFGVPGTRRIIATLSTGTLNAGAVGGLDRAAIEAAEAAIAQAAADAQTAAADAQSGVDSLVTTYGTTESAAASAVAAELARDQAQAAQGLAEDAQQHAETAFSNSDAARVASEAASTASAAARDAAQSAQASAETARDGALVSEASAELAAGGIINPGFEDGVAGAAGVPAGWELKQLVGSSAALGWLNTSTRLGPDHGSALCWGAPSTGSGTFQIGKRFLCVAGATISPKVWCYNADLSWFANYVSPGAGQTFFGEDDAILVADFYDADGALIETQYSRSWSQYQIEVEAVSSPVASGYLAEDFVAPTGASEVMIWLRAVEANNTVQSRSWVPANTSGYNSMTSFDDFTIASTASLIDISVGGADALSAARAAASSATIASASETAAGQSATAAQTSETNAATAADQASTSASQAATSATDAAGSASSASTSSGNAATSATSAGNSATAASGSASSAATSATNAGNSAAAALASETAAASSYGAAVATARDILPSRAVDPDYWTGNVATNSDPSTAGNAGAVVAVGGVGDALSFNATSNTTIGPKGTVRHDPDAIYEVHYTYVAVADGSQGYVNSRVGIYSWDSTSTVQDDNNQPGALDLAVTVADGVVTRTMLVGGSNVSTSLVDVKVLAAAATWRPHLRQNWVATPQTNGTLALISMTIRDVTARVAAEGEATAAAGSASAAAGSATSADTSATAAGTSAAASDTARIAAEAAQTAAESAEGGAGAAQAAAESARDGAVTAQTGAETAQSAALSSATDAANSATAAGGSAAAASGSASSAATQAGEASTSASAAQTAQVAAETARDDAQAAESGASSSASAAAASSAAAATNASDAQTQAAAAAADALQTSALKLQTRRDLMAMGALSPRVIMTTDYVIDVIAFEDDTQVFLNGVLRATLSAGGTHSVATNEQAAGDILSADKPIHAYQRNGGDELPALIQAGTELGFRSTRYYPIKLEVFSPYADARVKITMDSTDFSAPLYDITVGRGQVVTQSHSEATDVTRVWRIQASAPVVVYHHGTSSQDGHAIWPVAPQTLMGRGDSIYSFGGETSWTKSGNPAVGLAGNETVRLFGAIQGDGSGADSEGHRPLESLGDVYLMAETVHGYTLVAAEDVGVEIRTVAGVLKASHSLSGSLTAPASVLAGSQSGSGADPAALGWTDGPFIVTGTGPFLLRTNDPTWGEEYTPFGYRSSLRQAFNPGLTTAAGHFAQASAASAASASSSATDAASEATAAQEERIAAETAQANAAGSASAAASSESAAASHSTDAGNSAAAAAASAVTAQTAQDGAVDITRDLLPARASDPVYWTNNEPTTHNPDTAPNRGVAATDPSLGDYLAYGTTANWAIGPKGVVPHDPDAIYEVTYTFFAIDDGTEGYSWARLGLYSWNQSGVLQNDNYQYAVADEQVSIADGVVTKTLLVGGANTVLADSNLRLSGSATKWRPHLRQNQTATPQTNGEFGLLSLAIRDVTARVAAENQASAAATSASNAAASETAAGVSATASASSETNAATSASSAGTSATQASAAASDAQGHAAAAQASETNAATSETNASASAASAATSSSQAATSATAASNSASTASSDAAAASASAASASGDAASALASSSLAARRAAGVAYSWFGNADAASDWTVQNGAVTDGSASAIVTCTTFANASSGNTSQTRLVVPKEVAAAISGKKVKVRIECQNSTPSSSEMAVAFSTNSVGNSGWQTFTPGARQWFEFEYDVPDAGAVFTDHYIGVCSDTSGAGGAIEVFKIELVEWKEGARVDAHGLALADINGNLTASYSLTVDANGRIAGMKLLSDGTTATVAFAADEFRVSDGVTNFVPFEIVGGQVNLKNVSIDGVDILVASVPGSAITVGDVGVSYLHVDSFHDWYSTTTPSGDWRAATNFNDFGFTGDTASAEPGDRIELLLTYDNVAVLNAYEQFTFKDTMFIEIAYDDGSTGVYHPADETKERYALAARNVGVPPGTVGVTQITDSYFHRKVIDTDSGYPWTRTSPPRTMVGVKIRVQIEARNPGSTGMAIHGGTRSETYVRNSSKLVDIVMSVDVKRQGPINNI